MTRNELIKKISYKIPSDWVINESNISELSKIKQEASTIYIGKYSKRLKSYITQLKCYSYSGKNSVSQSGDKIIWYFHFNIGINNKELLIPNESTDDFIEIFINRYVNYLNIKEDLDKIENSINVLSNDDKLKTEIRDFKIKKVTKSENQE